MTAPPDRRGPPRRGGRPDDDFGRAGGYSPDDHGDDEDQAFRSGDPGSAGRGVPRRVCPVRGRVRPGAGAEYDLAPAEAVLDRWWGIAVIRANPLSEQEQLARARDGVFNGLWERDEAGSWVQL